MESPSSKCQPLFSFCLLLVILQCPQIDIVVVLIFYLEFIIVISEKVLLHDQKQNSLISHFTDEFKTHPHYNKFKYLT